MRDSFWALLLLALGACRPSKPLQPVTGEEARKFAQDVQDAMEKKRPAILNEIVDAQEFARRVAKNMNIVKVDKSLIKSVANGVAQVNFGGKIAESMGKDGRYELVKVYTKDDRQHMIFRLLGDDAGLNYHDFELLKREGKLKAADIFIYSLGENFSGTISQLLQTAGGNGLNNDRAREVAKLSEVRRLVQQEKFQEAQALLDGFSPEMQRQKTFLIVKAEVAGHINDSLYTAVLRDLEAAYPNEPNMHLMNMERHFMEKNYDKALDAINGLDRLIDKDPFLDYYRYLMLNQLKRNAEALATLERAVKAMPDYGPASLELMITYYDEGKKDKARALKQAYRANKKLNQKKLDDLLTVYPGL